MLLTEVHFYVFLVQQGQRGGGDVQRSNVERLWRNQLQWATCHQGLNKSAMIVDYIYVGEHLQCLRCMKDRFDEFTTSQIAAGVDFSMLLDIDGWACFFFFVKSILNGAQSLWLFQECVDFWEPREWSDRNWHRWELQLCKQQGTYISYLIENQCTENIKILNHKNLTGEDEVCWGERALPACPMLWEGPQNKEDKVHAGDSIPDSTT